MNCSINSAERSAVLSWVKCSSLRFLPHTVHTFKLQLEKQRSNIIRRKYRRTEKRIFEVKCKKAQTLNKNIDTLNCL